MTLPRDWWQPSRRTILKAMGSTALVLGVTKLGTMPAHAADAVTLGEIYMAAPNCFAVTAYDGAPTPGNRVLAYQDESATPYDSWVLRNNPRDGGALQACVLGGPAKSVQATTWLRFSDILATVFVNKATVKNPANWPTIGGRTVVAVRHRNLAQTRAGKGYLGTDIQHTNRHTFYLELDSDLPQGGPYTIGGGSTGLPSGSFTFNDFTTRAEGIHASQVGYRPSDPIKLAVLAARRPYGANGGAVNFQSAFGMPSFQLIDANNNIVHTGSIVQWLTPTGSESCYTNQYIADGGRELSIISITKASNGIFETSTPHGLSTNDRVRFRNVWPFASGGNSFSRIANATLATVTVTDATHFTCGINTSAFAEGSLPSGVWAQYENKCYPCNLFNRCGTYVYNMDFTSVVPPPGVYRIRIPGYGVSYPFRIDDAVYNKVWSQIQKGIISLERGKQINNGTYERAPNLRDDGVLHFRNYLSRVPASFSIEYAGISVVPNFNSGAACFDPNVRLDKRISLVDSGWGVQDAADVDTNIMDHAPAYWSSMQLFQELPIASRVTVCPPSVASSSTIGSRYAGTDHWPVQMHIYAWFTDFWASLMQPDGSVPSGIMIGHFSGVNPNQGDLSSTYRGTNSAMPDTAAAEGPGTLVHAIYYAADHRANLWVSALFSKFAQLCTEYGNTDLATYFIDKAIAARDWARSIYYSSGDLTITNVANNGSSQPRFTVASTADLVTGRTYHISDVVGSLGVGNGSQVVTVIDATTFDGTSFFNGTYTSGGRVHMNSAGECGDYYIGELDLKTAAFSRGSRVASVNATTDIVTLVANQGGLATNMKCRFIGTIDGLSTTTDYYISVSGLNISFHTNTTDSAAGTNKVNITGTTTGALVFRVMTDAEYDSHVNASHTSFETNKWTMDVSLARATGDSSYLSEVVLGLGTNEMWLDYIRTPGGTLAIRNYNRAHIGDGAGAELDWINTRTSGFPTTGFVSAQVTGSPSGWNRLSQLLRMYAVYTNPGDGVAPSTASADKIMKSVLCYLNSMTGCNLVNMSFVKGIGSDNQPIAWHGDGEELGMTGLYPDGIVPFGYFQWPNVSGGSGAGGPVGGLVWQGDDVAVDRTAWAYKVMEPWKYTSPHWESWSPTRGHVFMGEYSIANPIIPAQLAAAMVHARDSNTATEYDPGVPVVRGWWKKL
jgi:hypothetical protein